MRNRSRYLLQYILPLVVVAAFLLGVWRFADTAAKRYDQEGLQLTGENVRRAAVQCYALEGAYPTDVTYLYEHYGLHPDESRFLVYYVFIADNLMPDITVLLRE